MLKVGDRVYVQGTQEQGTVKEIHPHEALVRVESPAATRNENSPLRACASIPR